MGFIPHHLRRGYPAVLSLLLMTFSAEWWREFSNPYCLAVIWVWAGLAVALLGYGWLFNSKNVMWHGTWVASGFWGVQLSMVVYSGFSNAWPEESIVMLLEALAMLNLSIGIWVLMRMDPQCHVHWWMSEGNLKRREEV